MKTGIPTLSLIVVTLTIVAPSVQGEATLVRSIQAGPWSAPQTWDGGKIPAPGDRVHIRPGHEVVFDATIDLPIRSILVGGTLTFDPDRNTLLTVGLIKIQAGDGVVDESMLDVHSEMTADVDPGQDRPAVLVGTARRPISADHVALIRLAMVDGLDPEVCPAIICQGGRLELHGAPINPTWTKLGQTAKAGDSSVVLDKPVQGWKPGDRVIVTATRHQYAKDEDLTPKVSQAPQTEERLIRAIAGTTLTLDSPLSNLHLGAGAYRGEVALLSRNVVVESARPDGVRGHTMYHRGSAGSISFAEFRHLGKAGKLGKYSLHFHKVGDSMRGTSVVGASIWDSDNRWITIHASNRLVVRDCVGYRSLGHGFFLEDGTEVDNIFDGNLAVQALGTSSLPGQVLAYDRNDGAGFWWANNRNGFTRNVAVESDGYGFRFDAPSSPDFNPVMTIRGEDGISKLEDIRVLPFLRFDANESHSQRRYGVNLNGVAEQGRPKHGPPVLNPVGAESKHPLSIRGLLIWDSHWAFTPASPGLMVDGLMIAHSEYGFWKPDYTRQAYRGQKLFQCGKAQSGIIGQMADSSKFPYPLEPVDDRPPVTVITDVETLNDGRTRVAGSSMDNEQIKAVRVNSQEARPLVADFSRWELILDASANRLLTFKAEAEDHSGNFERTPHLLIIGGQPATAGSKSAAHSNPTH